LMVDARWVLRRNLEWWKHKACLGRWLGHLRLQLMVWLVSGRRVLRSLLLLSMVYYRRVRTRRLLRRKLLVWQRVLRLGAHRTILRCAIRCVGLNGLGLERRARRPQRW
jgi:hypothetical protein